MRCLNCQTSNMTVALIGKVTYGGIPTNQRSDYMLVVRASDKPDAKGYRAVITDGDSPYFQKRRIPMVCVDGLTSFSEGDILSVEPTTGTIMFLYEVNTLSNAILVTEECNCACLMCPQPPKHESESRTQFNCKLIRLMAPGPKELALTGGEPTLVGDQLLTLLRECQKWLPDTNVIVLSNGRRLSDRRYAEGLARLGHSRLTIAVALYADVDRLHDEIVGVKGAFGDTIRGLYTLALYGFVIEIRVVLLSLNYRRLPKIADFLYSNMPFASHVAFMGMETTGLAEKNLERVWVDPFDYRQQLEEACGYLSQRMIPVSVYNLPLCVLPPPLRRFARKSISEWKNIYLPECQVCGVKTKCGGFFESSGVRRSAYIFPIGD